MFVNRVSAVYSANLITQLRSAVKRYVSAAACNLAHERLL